MTRRILIQEQMRSEFVVVACVGREDPAQMGLAEDDDMIEGSSRSVSPHARFAKVNAGPSGDHGCPLQQAAL